MGKKFLNYRFQRVKSSKDGRPWKTWVTSNTKYFQGIRRKSTGLGSWVCVNDSCPFIDMYGGKKNMVQFMTNGNAGYVAIKELN